MTFLERIAYREMEGKTILEAFDVVEARFGCGVRSMKSDTEVETKNKKIKVIAQTGASAESNVAECFRSEFAAGTCRIVAQQPHIARIEEYSPIKIAEKARPEFQIGFQFNVSGLVYIGILAVGTAVGAGTDGTHGESADAVGSAYVELISIRGMKTVAVAANDTGKETRGQFETLV